MSEFVSSLNALSSAVRSLGESFLRLLQERLKLASLELREVKLRFFQLLVLTCVATVCLVAGFLALLAVAVFCVPVEWRPYGAACAALFCLITGFWALYQLRRTLQKAPLPFNQTLEDLQKDAQYFSKKN